MPVSTQGYHLAHLLVRKQRLNLVVLVDLQTEDRSFYRINENYALFVVCYYQPSVFGWAHYPLDSLRQIDIRGYRYEPLFTWWF